MYMLSVLVQALDTKILADIEREKKLLEIVSMFNNVDLIYHKEINGIWASSDLRTEHQASLKRK